MAKYSFCLESRLYQSTATMQDVTLSFDNVTYLHPDHLGSTALTTNAQGAMVSEARFKPFGEERYTGGNTPTDFRFGVNARTENSVPGVGVGSVVDMNARLYSPVLAKFLSADTIVSGPGNPQNLNRYAYALGNPLRYTDPSGHSVCNTQSECTQYGTTPNGNELHTSPPLSGEHVVVKFKSIGIDPNHADPGIAQTVIDQVTKFYQSGNSTGFADVSLTQGQKFGFPPGCAKPCKYNVSYRLTSGFQANQIASVALAIYMDAQSRFEAAQGLMDFPVNSTSFQHEDLFSDYVGFVSAFTGKSVATIADQYYGGQVGTRSDAGEFILGFSAIGKSPFFGWDALHGNKLPAGIVIGPSDSASGFWAYQSMSAAVPWFGTNLP